MSTYEWITMILLFLIWDKLDDIYKHMKGKK